MIWMSVCKELNLMVSKFADDKKLTHQSRRTFLWSETGTVAALILRSSNAALVDVKLVLSNIKAFPIPCPEGQTTVTGGTSFGVQCFKITGDVNNPVKQSVYNADIFGRVYDAQGEAALDALSLPAFQHHSYLVLR